MRTPEGYAIFNGERFYDEAPCLEHGKWLMVFKADNGKLIVTLHIKHQPTDAEEWVDLEEGDPRCRTIQR